MADTKKEYTSNLHPKGDMDTTVYPNIKSENIIDKDTTAYTAGKVPDSSLVSKSLDDLNEKIETNKIQTETNKTNIATLQGNVSSLKQDNTQNKQDIANLKANYTEVQSQANTNSSDIALLETNAIKKDTDASLKTLTLPSASDLKTKDGTTFGGGSSIYNGTEFLPTFDISTLSNEYLSLSAGGTVTGEVKVDNNLRVFNPQGYNENKIKIGDIKIYDPASGFAFENVSGIALESELIGISLNGYRGGRSIYISVGPYSGIKMNKDGTGGMFINNQSDIYISRYKDRKIVQELTLKETSININDSPIVTQATLTSDLDTKQDKRFVHTVEIHYASNGSYFCFTGTSDKNTPIDSVEDLTTVFANRDLVGVGIFGSAGLSKIHVGSSINDTTFKKYMNNGEYATPSEETFAMVFNTTGFTITDNVTAM